MQTRGNTIATSFPFSASWYHSSLLVTHTINSVVDTAIRGTVLEGTKATLCAGPCRRYFFWRGNCYAIPRYKYQISMYRRPFSSVDPLRLHEPMPKRCKILWIYYSWRRVNSSKKSFTFLELFSLFPGEATRVIILNCTGRYDIVAPWFCRRTRFVWRVCVSQTL